MRWCSDDFEIHEDFVGIRKCQSTDSESLLEDIKEILTNCKLDPKKMAGMSFDGASNMKCLGKLIKRDINEDAIYTHCFAHCNELVFKDATKCSQTLYEAQHFCEELYVFIGVSPKRITLFESFQTESCKRLENLSKTRWTTRGPALKVVLEKNQELQSTLKLLAEDKSVEIRSKARGLLKKIQDPDLLTC